MIVDPDRCGLNVGIGMVIDLDGRVSNRFRSK